MATDAPVARQLVIKHVAVPALAPTTLLALYFTPVTTFGCLNRGLMALAVTFGAALLAFVTVGIGIRMRVRKQPGAEWWALSTLVLALTLALMLGLA
jgi:hypothetical protein